MSCGKTFLGIFVMEPTITFKMEWAKTNRIDFLMYAKLFLQFSTFQTLARPNPIVCMAKRIHSPKVRD